MNQITRHIPNILTLGNLISGTIGVIMIFRYDTMSGAYFIWGGAVFDFLDGFSARTLNANSDIGKELDSLADMITFGLLPSLIIFNQLTLSFPAGSCWPFISLLTVLFSALRLAKFNIDAGQKEVFIGLPTPANAFLLSGIPFLSLTPVFHFCIMPVFLIPVIIITSILMVSSLEFISLKFKNTKINKNLERYLIIITGIILIVLLGTKGVTLAIVGYIIISIWTYARTYHKTSIPD